MSELKFVVVKISDLRHITVLRQRILGVDCLDGDSDSNTKHFAVFQTSGGSLYGGAVGCASFMLDYSQGKPIWNLRGFAVDLEFIGKGVAELLYDKFPKFFP